MKKLLIFLIVITICFTIYLIGYSITTTTTNLELIKIARGDLTTDYLDTLNTNLDTIDSIFDTVTLIEFNYLNGATSNIQAQLDSKATGDLTLYYLKTEINTQAKVETIWGVSLVNDGDLDLYYLKTAIDTIGEVEAIWIKDITDSTELASALTNYYLKTAIDTLGEVETIYTKDIIDSDELAALKFTDLNDTPANYTGQAGKYVKVNAGETALEFGTPAGAGTVTTSGTPEVNDIARFTGATVIEGLSYDELITALTLNSDDLSDVASIAMLDEYETVIAGWEFTELLAIKEEHDFYSMGPLVAFYRYRDGDPTVNVSDGDWLGSFEFYGRVGDNYDTLGAQIAVVVDGTPGIDYVPGRLEFWTSNENYETLLRFEIDNAGNIRMGDGAWTNYINVTAVGAMTAEGTASIKATDLVIANQAAGDILYFNGTNWIRLAIGTAGQILTVNAGATAPEWQTP